jgi:hypothetical protein
MARKSCNALLESSLNHILTTKQRSITMGEYTYGLPLLLFFFLRYSGQGINPMKYKMLIKMDSEAFVAASPPWVDLIVSHQNI